MFHLNTGVHLHKIEVAVFIDQKFNGSAAFVIHSFCGFYCGITHLIAKFLSHEGRWRFFYQFLVAALNGAIAFAKVNHLAVLITDNLYLDMAGFLDVFLHVHAIVTEGSSGFLTGRIPGCFEVFFFPNDTHTTTTTTGSSLKNYRILNLLGNFLSVGNVVEQAFRARNGRHSGQLHGFFGHRLIAHFLNLLGRCPDEFDAMVGADF